MTAGQTLITAPVHTIPAPEGVESLWRRRGCTPLQTRWKLVAVTGFGVSFCIIMVKLEFSTLSHYEERIEGVCERVGKIPLPNCIKKLRREVMYVKLHHDDTNHLKRHSFLRRGWPLRFPNEVWEKRSAASPSIHWGYRGGPLSNCIPSLYYLLNGVGLKIKI